MKHRRWMRRFAAAIGLAGLCLAFGDDGRAAPIASENDLPPMQSMLVHGQTIRYYDVGTGPDLVLLHGLGSSAGFDWGRVIPELAKHHHVLAMDQLGFGSSAKPLIQYGVQTWVDMLDGFLNARGVHHFALAGESLGGWIAALYVEEAETDRRLVLPQKLILSDAAGHASIVHAASRPFGRAVSLASVRAGLEMLFHDHSLITDSMVQTAFDRRLAEGNQFTQDSFWRTIDDPDTFLDGRLGAITVPTLVIWGGDDRLVPLADGRDFAARIPHAALKIIPDCGHGPAIERPADYLAAVEPFLGTGR